MPTISKKKTNKKHNHIKKSRKNTKETKGAKNTVITDKRQISNKRQTNKSKKESVVQKGGNTCGPKKSQPLRPRLYNKAQSSNILADYPNAPPFPPDFLGDCAIM